MDTKQTKLVNWSPTTLDYNKNPYLNLSECLEHNPVQQGIYGEWIVFRYEHVKQLLRDPTCLTADLAGFFEQKEKILLKNTNQCPFLTRSTKKWLMYLDGEEHQKARELIEKVLKCYNLDKIVDDCLRKWFDEFFLDQKPDLTYIASILPSLIFLSMYQPTGDDWDSFTQLKKVSNSLASSQDVYVSIKQYQAYNLDAEWLFTIIAKDFDKDTFSDHAFITNLKRVNEEMGRPFSKDDLVSIVIIAFFASLETTFDTITNSIYEFFKNPALLDFILEADTKQINVLAEELLRHATPQQYTIRINTKPLELGGSVIPANAKIFLCLASANRDPSVFENPHEIVPERSYNPHLSFGSGTHACIGAKLARIELRALLKPLAGILKNYKLDESMPLEWQRGIFMRGIKNLWGKKIS